MLFENAKRGQLSSGLRSECNVGYADLWLYSLRECNVGYPDPLLTRSEKVCKEATPISAEKVSAPALPYSPIFSVTCFSHLSQAIFLALFIKAVLIRQNCLQLSQPSPPHVIHTYHTHSHIIYTHHTHTEVRQVYWLEAVCYRPKVYKTSGKVPLVNALARGPLAKHKGKEGPEDGRNMGATLSARAKDAI